MKATVEDEPGLLRVPLFIKLLADVYDPQEPIKNKADLLEKYIERKLSFDQREFDRRKELEKSDWAYETVKREPKFDETINSLYWVARQLQANNKVELLIEQIQPSWLESKALKLRYGLMMGLIFGLIFGLMMGLIFGLIFGLIGGLIGGLISGDVEVVEAFQIPRSKTARQSFFKEFRKGLIRALIMGQIGVLIWGLIWGSIWWSISGLMVGLMAGLMVGLIGGLIDGLKQELKERSRPNQGIWNSLQSVIWTAAFSYPLVVIPNASSFLFGKGSVKNPDWLHLLSSALPDYLLVGIFWSLYFGIYLGGGMACINHFSLRLVLWQSGTIPWNFARFLNYCVERRLLLRVGGRYRFLHRELLDHFAQLPPGTQIK